MHRTTNPPHLNAQDSIYTKQKLKTINPHDIKYTHENTGQQILHGTVIIQDNKQTGQ